MARAPRVTRSIRERHGGTWSTSFTVHRCRLRKGPGARRGVARACEVVSDARAPTELAGALPRRWAATPNAELAQHAQQPRLPGDPPDVQRALQTIRPDAHQGDISRCLCLETRWLHALARKKAVDRFAMDAQDPANAHRIESAVVDQPPDRLRMHAKLIRRLAYADKPGISACRRHCCAPCRSPVTRRAAPPSTLLSERRRESAHRFTLISAPSCGMQAQAQRGSSAATIRMRKLRNRSVELWKCGHLLSKAGVEANVCRASAAWR